LGVVAPDEGWIEVAGHRLPRGRSQAMAEVGFAAGYLPLPERLKVDEYLRFYGQLYGVADPDVETALGRFGVAHLARARGTDLSSGQRTLVGIVKAILHRPRLLILDEPTASLDPDVALRVRTGLQALCRDEHTTLSVARRHYYVLLRAPHRLFDVTIWPLVDVLLFGSIAAFVSPGNAGAGKLAAGYLLSGILLWHVVYQSQIALATGFLEEAWTRNLLNLMVTPMREAEYVAGVVLFGMVKLFMGLAVVSLTALGFFAFNVTDLGIGLIPVAAVLLVAGWLIALFVIALVLRFGTGAEA